MASTIENWIDSDMISGPQDSLLPQQEEPSWDDFFIKSASMSMTESGSGCPNPSSELNYKSPAYDRFFTSLTAPTSAEVLGQNSPHIKTEYDDFNFPNMYETLTDKLENMQKNRKLTSKLLELMFDTKDILKDENSTVPKRGKSIANLCTIAEEKKDGKLQDQSFVLDSPIKSFALLGDQSSSCIKTEQNESATDMRDANGYGSSGLRKSSVSSTASSGNRKKAPRKRLTDLQKQAHNKIEKKYRININAKIAGLQSIIPWLATESTAFETGISNDTTMNCHSNKLNKSMILEKATAYIKYLQEQQRQDALEIQRLRDENARLRYDGMN